MRVFFRPLLSPLWGETWAGSLAPWAPTVPSDYLLAGSRLASDPIPSPTSSLGPSDPRPGLGLPVRQPRASRGAHIPQLTGGGVFGPGCGPGCPHWPFLQGGDPTLLQPQAQPASSSQGTVPSGGRASGQLVAAQLADLVVMGLRITGFLAGSTASRPERQPPVQIATVCLPGSAQCTLAPLLSRRP